MNLRVRDIHWLSGILEGEGSFGVNYRRTGLTIQLGMCDEDVVVRASKIFKTATCGPYKTTAGRPRWHTTVQGSRAAQWMMTLYPLMGSRRKERIRECLGHWKAGMPRRMATCHPNREVEVRGLCRPCNDIRTGYSERRKALKRASYHRRKNPAPSQEA